jgi:3-methyl-2-oxobutanoate hydroxymethyltransferase
MLLTCFISVDISYIYTIIKTNRMSAANKEYKRVTVKSLIEMKANEEKISMLTAYDYTMAKIVDGAGIDVILVGDSASNVMAGHETTLPITLDQMIYHASSVVRAIDRCLVVVDLPFGSYQSDPKEALRSAIRIMKESGGHSIKLEGGKEGQRVYQTYFKCGHSCNGTFGINPPIYLQVWHLYRKSKRGRRSRKTNGRSLDVRTNWLFCLGA